MHELSITRNIVAIVAERAAGRRVLRITLEIGALTAIMPEAIRFCFPMCAKNTVADDAKLEIIDTQGDELKIKEMEID